MILKRLAMMSDLRAACGFARAEAKGRNVPVYVKYVPTKVRKGVLACWDVTLGRPEPPFYKLRPDGSNIRHTVSKYDPDVVRSRATAFAKTRRLARAALRRGLPEWQRVALEREIAGHEAALREERRSAAEKHRRDPGPARTGIRSGVAPRDVWHLRDGSHVGSRVLCGARRWRASVSTAGGVERALHTIPSQGGTPCARCLRRISS